MGKEKKLEEKTKGEILKFGSVGGKDVYNPTAPFVDKGTAYIAARVESRDIETDSQTMFFSEKNGVWHPDENMPVFELQDPFVTKIHGKLIFGGVEVFPSSNPKYKLDFKTIFYRGENIPGLKKFAEGPIGMKDIRLVGLPDGKIGVFTRPQKRAGGSKIGGKGRIGYMAIGSLDSLSKCDFYSADLIKGQFSKKEWGGVNEAFILKDGLLGILGHKASSPLDEKRRKIKHYYPTAFTFGYLAKKASPVEIIATRADFPKGAAKRSPELDDVVFSGGLILKGEYAELYVGLSDVNVGKITIPNPFKKEKE